VEPNESRVRPVLPGERVCKGMRSRKRKEKNKQIKKPIGIHGDTVPA
jgi:hypothetical protein